MTSANPSQIQKTSKYAHQIGAAHLDVSEYPEAASFQGLKAVELLATALLNHY